MPVAPSTVVCACGIVSLAVLYVSRLASSPYISYPEPEMKKDGVFIFGLQIGLDSDGLLMILLVEATVL